MKKILIILTTLMLFTFNVNAQVPTPNIVNNSQYCIGTTKVYGDNPLDPANTYTFSISPTQSFTAISGGDQFQVTWNTAGTYTLTLTETDVNGCVNTYVSTIVVTPNVIATINPIVVCQSGATQPITGSNLGTSPIYSGTGVVATVFDPTGLIPGTYTITVNSTTSAGCPITGTGTATVNPPPSGNISEN